MKTEPSIKTIFNYSNHSIELMKENILKFGSLSTLQQKTIMCFTVHVEISFFFLDSCGILFTFIEITGIRHECIADIGNSIELTLLLNDGRTRMLAQMAHLELRSMNHLVCMARNPISPPNKWTNTRS